MRIEKREDGWWITGVTPYRVDDVVHDAYGPYATKAAAQDDLEGLTSFFEQHPELTSAPPLLEVGTWKSGNTRRTGSSSRSRIGRRCPGARAP